MLIEIRQIRALASPSARALPGGVRPHSVANRSIADAIADCGTARNERRSRRRFLSGDRAISQIATLFFRRNLGLKFGHLSVSFRARKFAARHFARGVAPIGSSFRVAGDNRPIGFYRPPDENRKRYSCFVRNFVYRKGEGPPADRSFCGERSAAGLHASRDSLRTV